jgi:hypothetical protein
VSSTPTSLLSLVYCLLAVLAPGKVEASPRVERQPHRLPSASKAPADGRGEGLEARGLSPAWDAARCGRARRRGAWRAPSSSAAHVCQLGRTIMPCTVCSEPFQAVGAFHCRESRPSPEIRMPIATRRAGAPKRPRPPKMDCTDGACLQLSSCAPSLSDGPLPHLARPVPLARHPHSCLPPTQTPVSDPPHPVRACPTTVVVRGLLALVHRICQTVAQRRLGPSPARLG